MPSSRNAAHPRALSECLSGHVRTVVTYGNALAVAVVAGTVVMLFVSAAVTLRYTGDAWGAAVLAMVAMWIPQQLITAARYRRP